MQHTARHLAGGQLLPSLTRRWRHPRPRRAINSKARNAWGTKGSDRSYLKAITHPVLVVNGSKAIMIPSVNTLILQQELPIAQAIIYPDASHGSQFQYADHFVEDVARFFFA